MLRLFLACHFRHGQFPAYSQTKKKKKGKNVADPSIKKYRCQVLVGFFHRPHRQIRSDRERISDVRVPLKIGVSKKERFISEATNFQSFCWKEKTWNITTARQHQVMEADGRCSFSIINWVVFRFDGMSS